MVEVTHDNYLQFGGMAWPNPDDPNEVQYRLRYGSPSKHDLMIAASHMCAYAQLVEDSQRVRNEKVTGIRRERDAQRALKRSQPTGPPLQESDPVGQSSPIINENLNSPIGDGLEDGDS
jgi:hypothetical protein